MTSEALLINQYHNFTARWHHFGSLFWQIPAVVGVLLAGLFSILKDVGLTLWFFMLASGIAFGATTYVAYRFKSRMEDLETTMTKIEEKLRAMRLGASFQSAPPAKKLGAKFAFVAMLAVITVVLIGIGLAFISICVAAPELLVKRACRWTPFVKPLLQR